MKITLAFEGRQSKIEGLFVIFEKKQELVNSKEKNSTAQFWNTFLFHREDYTCVRSKSKVT